LKTNSELEKIIEHSSRMNWHFSAFIYIDRVSSTREITMHARLLPALSHHCLAQCMGWVQPALWTLNPCKMVPHVVITILKFLILFEQQTQYIHFVLVPANYIAGSLLRYTCRINRNK